MSDTTAFRLFATSVGVLGIFSLRIPFHNPIFPILIFVALLTIGTTIVGLKSTIASYSSACYTTAGALFGIVADLFMFPTVNGYERNLFPFEIALWTFLAAAVSFTTALVLHAVKKWS